MTSRFAPALVAACVLTSPLAAQQLQGRDGTRFTWSERVPAGQWLRVYGSNGRIQVTEATGDAAEVVGEKELRRGRPEDIAFDVRRTSEGVTICAVIADEDCDDDGVRHRGRWSDDYNGRRVNFTIRVPKGVHVAVGSGNGDVSVGGATADVRASSGNGKVRVTTSGGAVNASSGNGEVNVEHAGGPVRASSGNGRVTVVTSRGPVNASSGNGDVEVSMDAIADVSDDMELSSGNGTITVTVPADFAGELDASTGSGKFYSDFPMTLRGRIDPQHVRATIGKGGRRLTMRSGNGDVELRKK
jgi:putative adhesin